MDHIPGAEMVAVDLWEPQPEREGEGTETYADWSHADYCGRFAKAMTGKNVRIMKMRTDEACKQIADGSLDFVFVDADHSYEGVKRDIADWTPKVRKGGIVFGHDYNWPTVRRAAEEAFGDVQGGPNNVWLAWR